MTQFTISHKGNSAERVLLALKLVGISLLFVLANFYNQGPWVTFRGVSYGMSQEEITAMGESHQSTLAQE